MDFDKIEYEKHLRNVLDHYYRNVCTHEETYRGGILWTICSQCGQRWADDEGGFKAYSDPPEIEAANEFLKNI